MYKKTEKNMKGLEVLPFPDDKKREIAAKLLEIAKEYGVVIETCAEGIDLEGIEHGHCIDGRLIGKLLNFEIDEKLDKQREFCGCLKCVDIGQYNTCTHLCAYCYANYSEEKVRENVRAHDPDSPYIVGEGYPGVTPTVRKDIRLKPLVKYSGNLFNKSKKD